MSTNVIVVDQPSAVNQFSATEILSLSNHPDETASWPSWATIAMVHSLGEKFQNGCDLYVTYASDATIYAQPQERTEICGIDIEVVRLLYWDWGPVEAQVADCFVINQASDRELRHDDEVTT